MASFISRIPQPFLPAWCKYLSQFSYQKLKGFIRLENLNSVNPSSGFSFTQYNYVAPGYPARALWLRIGIWWSFVNWGSEIKSGNNLFYFIYDLQVSKRLKFPPFICNIFEPVFGVDIIIAIFIDLVKANYLKYPYTVIDFNSTKIIGLLFFYWIFCSRNSTLFSRSPILSSLHARKIQAIKIARMKR